MNETKYNIEISGAIIEQIQSSSLNEEEPTKYWKANYQLSNLNSSWCSAYTTERAAWIAREHRLSSGYYVSTGMPFEVTREELDALTKASGCTEVRVLDETGTVVDWWSVR